MTKDEQLQILTEEYLPKFLGFAVNKIGNIDEAEELAQEIAVQAVIAIRRGGVWKSFDAYLWGIANNTFKRWCMRRSACFAADEDVFSNLPGNDPPLDEQLEHAEEIAALRLALSRLAGSYREVLVCFYFDELSIREIGQRLSLSEAMVKFYLRAGKQKLQQQVKEMLSMQTIGQTSFRPLPFSVYKSAIDFSRVNVWEVFKRKLPCQIAILCHEGAKTMEELSAELGTPAVYLEEELSLLLDAGVMISPVKGKYRTNLHILREDAVEEIHAQFRKLYASYLPAVRRAYEQYLPELKQCGVFQFDASPNQWAWYFARNIPAFEQGLALRAEDYPQILSCGSKGFIFAQTAEGSVWGTGCTPTYLEDCTVYACDVVAFGPYHCQKELWDKRKAQALCDISRGVLKEEDKPLYAELIEQGYAFKRDGNLLCNVAVRNQKSRALLGKVQDALMQELRGLCGEIRSNISRVVHRTLPEQLSAYADGFTETWIFFYAGVYLTEALYEAGFLALPDEGAPTPLACWIEEKDA